MRRLLLHRFSGGGGEQQHHHRRLERQRHHPRFLLPAVLAPNVLHQDRFGCQVHQRNLGLQRFVDVAPQRAVPRYVQRDRQQQSLQVVRGRDHSPAEFRGTILHTCPIAPVPYCSAKMRERCCETGDFRLARRALLGVLALFKTDVTDEIHEYSLLGQMIVHLVPSSLARTDWSARKRWVLTVPSFIPVTSAISRRSMSSTNRSRNTVRCR